MHKLIRFYNQNRKKFWIIVIIIILVIVLMRLLNFFALKQLEEDNKKIEEKKNGTSNNNFEEEGKSIISGGQVDSSLQKKLGTLIDNFYNFCIKGEYEKAYQLISNQCREELYPTAESFKSKYCAEKFNGNKQFSFQSWTSKGDYIYHIKIFDNMLASGKKNSEYIEEYVSVIREENEYKLNINSFIGKKDYFNKNAKNGQLAIQLNSLRAYMDYMYCDFIIQNNGDNTIILDNREQTDGIYITDEKQVKYEALLNENKDEDLTIQAKEKKKITIKFSRAYQSKLTLKQIVFSRIIMEQSKYEQSKENYQDFKQIQINL